MENSSERQNSIFVNENVNRTVYFKKFAISISYCLSYDYDATQKWFQSFYSNLFLISINFIFLQFGCIFEPLIISTWIILWYLSICKKDNHLEAISCTNSSVI